MTVHESETASEKRELAGRIEAAGWGVFFVWVGLAWLADVGWGVGLIGAGLITLAAQAWRSRSAVKVDRFAATLGVLFVIVGVWNLFALRVDVVPLLFIAAGVGILASAWRNRDGHERQAGLTRP
jgi:hypothetical protein